MAIWQSRVAQLESYTSPQLSVAATFFHSYPRFTPNSTTFATTPEYRAAIHRLAIPYLSVGAFLLIAALVANVYFFAFHDVVPGSDDSYESDPDKRDNVAKSFLLFSWFFNIAIILCIALSFSSSYTMKAAANTAHDVLAATCANVTEHVALSAQLLDTYATQVAKVNPATFDQRFSKLAGGVQSIFANHASSFANLLNSTSTLSNDIDTIDKEVRHFSNGFFWFTLAVLLSCIAGLLSTFVCDAVTPDSRRTRIFAFSFLLIPVAATWTHAAVSTWVAVASGDFCYSVNDYHHAVSNQATTRGTPQLLNRSNVFAQLELQCPMLVAGARDFKHLNDFLGSSNDVFGFAGFSLGLNALINEQVTPDSWGKSREWMQDRWEFYKTCDTQVLLASKLTYHICGDHGLSAMSAIGQQWLCSCALALLFPAVVALLTWGQPPSEFCSGREMMYLYGAPKLISAFGDVESACCRQSTFWKLEASMYGSGTSGTTSDTDDLRKLHDTFDDDSTMSTERPRRNAYLSNHLSSQKAQGIDWVPDSDTCSSDSSRLL